MISSNILKIGLISFNLGIFLLFSAPFISGVFFLLSLIIAFPKIKDNPLEDLFNVILLIVMSLMITSCILFKLLTQEFIYRNNLLNYTEPFIGLFNWIPLFFCFCGFQIYLLNEEQRKLAGISLIFGTIPVLVSGLGQYFFDWYGPLNFLNGLIIWYQRENQTGLTSLFNNQNYAGCALATAWPFFFASFFDKKINLGLKTLSFFLNFLVIFEILLTTSRNSFFSLICGLLILIIPLRLKVNLKSLMSIILIFFIGVFFSIFLNFENLPFTSLSRLNYQLLVNDPRVRIWNKSIGYILQRPFLGWGGHGFAPIWNYENDIRFLHSHSIPLELSIQYGILTSLIISLFVFLILIKSFKKIFLDNRNLIIKFEKNNQYERAWFSASVIILISNTVDILYFDVRISLLLWILLAGLRNIIKK